MPHLVPVTQLPYLLALPSTDSRMAGDITLIGMGNTGITYPFRIRPTLLDANTYIFYRGPNDEKANNQWDIEYIFIQINREVLV